MTAAARAELEAKVDWPWSTITDFEETTRGYYRVQCEAGHWSDEVQFADGQARGYFVGTQVQCRECGRA